MRYREIAMLITLSKTMDKDGYPVTQEYKKEVYVDAKTVRRNEFYEAMRSGLSLAAVFVMRSCDYEGEKLLDYDGKRYKVERAYTKDGEMMELNCSEWKGDAA